MSQQASKSRLILIELLFAVLCFALVSAFCVQVFVKAQLISERTKQQNAALALLTTTAGYIKADDGDFSALSSHLSLSQSGNTLNAYYDKNWSACPKAEAVYTMTIEKTGDEAYMIRVLAKSTVLLEQKIIYHSPITEAEAVS